MQFDFVRRVAPASQFNSTELSIKRVVCDVDPAVRGEHPGLFPFHFPRVSDPVQQLRVRYNTQVGNAVKRNRYMIIIIFLELFLNGEHQLFDKIYVDEKQYIR